VKRRAFLALICCALVVLNVTAQRGLPPIPIEPVPPVPGRVFVPGGMVRTPALLPATLGKLPLAPLRSLPALRPGGLGAGVVRLPVRLAAAQLLEPGLPLSSRLNGQREVLSFHAGEYDWEGLRLAVPKNFPVDLPVCAGRQLKLVQSEAHSLRSLTEFRLQLGMAWNPPKEGEDLHTLLAELVDSLPPEDAALLKQYLGYRAILEDQPVLAAQMLGTRKLPDGPELLRDLKRIGDLPGSPPPPAVSSLDGLPRPEPGPLSWRPAVKEKLGLGLPELEEIPAAEQNARRRILDTLEWSAFRHGNHMHIALYNLRSISNLVHSEDDDSDRRANTTRVETFLGRQLKAEERLLVRHLLRTSAPEKVAAKLGECDSNDR
jgi:hypothetical protein